MEFKEESAFHIKKDNIFDFGFKALPLDSQVDDEIIM